MSIDILDAAQGIHNTLRILVAATLADIELVGRVEAPERHVLLEPEQEVVGLDVGVDERRGGHGGGRVRVEVGHERPALDLLLQLRVVDEARGLDARALAGRYLGPLDHEQLGHDVNEETLHPARHLVRVRLAMMQVEYEDGEQDTQIDEYEREQEILAE